MRQEHRSYRALLVVSGLLLALAVVTLFVLLLTRHGGDDGGDDPQAEPAAAAPTVYEPETPDVDGVATLSFDKMAPDAIRLTWTDADPDARIAVMRRAASGGDWQTRAALDPGENAYIDKLDSDAPQQYLYRVDLVSESGRTLAKGAAIPASNISVCIDPGHFLNYSPLNTEASYGYEEGLVMLRLGLELRTVLRQNYGISAIMTRETDSITIDDYTNSELDNHHLTLRGTFAEGQDLFISLHSNANLDNANGYPTLNQPVAANKTLVFVNQVALASDRFMQMANAVGKQVTAANAAAGLTTTGYAFTDGERGSLITWSDAFNDGLDTPGTVCYRDGETHQDYYGVLRGAASVNVPGLIVEHGLHTVAEVRKAAMEGDLVRRWAEADAAGIAEGFGFEVPKA